MSRRRIRPYLSALALVVTALVALSLTACGGSTGGSTGGGASSSPGTPKQGGSSPSAPPLL